MYLHEDGDQLVRVSEIVARWAGQPASHVVKDYYVTLMLRETLAANDQLVFKGGTALSKCYGVIKRFSEDIDLGIEESYATQGQRKKIKAAITGAAKKLGLEIANLDQTRYAPIFQMEKSKSRLQACGPQHIAGRFLVSG